MKGYCWIQQHFPSQKKLRCSFFENGKKKKEELFANVFGKTFNTRIASTEAFQSYNGKCEQVSPLPERKLFLLPWRGGPGGKVLRNVAPFSPLEAAWKRKAFPHPLQKRSGRKKKEWGAFFIGVVLKKREEDGPFKTQWEERGRLNCQVTSSRPQGGFRPLFFHQTFRQKGRTVGGWSG